jgi:magnesium-transporting ATPase (P-type)
LALVVYTGVETKLHLNLTKYRFKMSHLEYYYNIIMVINVILMLVMAAAMSYACYAFADDLKDTHTYLFEGLESPEQLGGAAFLSFYLILNSFIPLEIPVMVELSKFMATFFLQRDAWMMNPRPFSSEPARLNVNTMNLHEELGEISYVFCDKTGTLTQNELIFSHFSLVHSLPGLRTTSVFDTRSMDNDLLKSELDAVSLDQNTREFFNCINLCQDCIVVPKPKAPKGKKDFAYQG